MGDLQNGFVSDWVQINVLVQFITLFTISQKLKPWKHVTMGYRKLQFASWDFFWGFFLSVNSCSERWILLIFILDFFLIVIYTLGVNMFWKMDFINFTFPLVLRAYSMIMFILCKIVFMYWIELFSELNLYFLLFWTELDYFRWVW